MSLCYILLVLVGLLRRSRSRLYSAPAGILATPTPTAAAATTTVASATVAATAAATM